MEPRPSRPQLPHPPSAVLTPSFGGFGLRRMPGITVESSIRRSLSPHQADLFDHHLRQNKDLASAVDVNFFPSLVQRNWREAFSTAFGDERTIQNQLWMIAEARNQVSHPATQDLDAEYTRARLYDIADALGRINASEQKRRRGDQGSARRPRCLCQRAAESAPQPPTGFGER